MDQPVITPVVLCGGSGTRLWPLSRTYTPKQFLPLTSSYSMLQETVLRLPKTINQGIFICNEEHRFMLAEQLRKIDANNSTILLEPEGRNTAPAVALAALQAIKDNPHAMLLVLAADHVISDHGAFHQAIEHATAAALQDKLTTFGIVPDKPETGYGYIQHGNDGEQFHSVKQFVEKPALDVAKQYVASGDYLWNSGMFLFKASCFIDELEKYCPEILVACQQAFSGAEQDLDFIRPEKSAFLSCVSESIDYAVMEKTSNAAVVPLNAGWSDVGSYGALADVLDKSDEKSNVFVGDVLTHETSECYINSQHKLVATVGVENLVIVDTPDAVLVANKDKAQDVKAIVEQLKQQSRSEVSFQREVYRPWGKYDSIDMGERFQVKRITVKPGAKLSVQMHHHRAEHWIVVSGTAKVTIGETTSLLSENMSTYIPIGEVHALENPGKLPLEMIEVQSGSYLGEDDIVRFEDRYGRS
uniref:mannose-1-phosphate guanylyltransferase/mannose-6-phosphate isomerase n=1 Tax=Thalassotalea hakodatensis TaxID=3030492 RepID=UPI0025740A5D|nr:mannose-1-phosphate guanylyltransferase/mannose-6-phosphate isomerase [Thalassotalea hakodatensis]